MNNNGIRKLLLIFYTHALLINILFSEQNNYRIETITIENGLPDNVAYGGIVQDSLGFIWIGSKGIHRYDGYSFKSYYPGSGDRTEQRQIPVNNLFTDKKKGLWISLNGGLEQYNYTKENFKQYYFTDDKQDTIPYDVYALEQDRDGEYYLGINFAPESLFHQDLTLPVEKYNRVGIYKFNPPKGEFTPIEFINKELNKGFIQNSLSETAIKGIYETTIVFPARHANKWLLYKFCIVRNEGLQTFEPNPNKEKVGNTNYRLIKLNKNHIELPVVAFNSDSDSSKIKTSSQLNPNQPIQVKFQLDISNLKSPLEKDDRIDIRGSFSPLTWWDHTYISDIAFDGEDNLWVASRKNGLFVFDLQSKAHKHFYPSAHTPNDLSSVFVRKIFADSDGEIWIGTDRGLNKYNPAQNNFSLFTKKNGLLQNQIYDVVEYPDGVLWIAYYNYKGVTRYDKRKGTFSHLEADLLSLSRSMCVDNSGIIWLGSVNRGISKINANPLRFNQQTGILKDINLPENRYYYSIYEDEDNNLWLGGLLDGLHRYNRITGKHFIYKEVSNNPDSLSSDYIRSIYKDKDGFFWICAWTHIIRYDLNKNKFRKFTTGEPNNKNSLQGVVFTGICETTDFLWILSENGFLNRYDPQNNMFKNYYLGPHVYVDLISEDGFLWIISGKGLIKFDPILEQAETIVKCYEATTLAIDSSGTIWFDNNEGLSSYNIKTKISKKALSRDRLLTNAITAIEVDNNNNIWMSSKFGISRYIPPQNKLKHYFKEDGFKTNEFSYWGSYKNQYGEIYFGSMDGLILFHPDSIKDSHFIPPVVLTELKINNKKVDTAYEPQFNMSISTAKEINLKYYQNDISLTFASLDFSLPQRNKYTFILENYDEDWRMSATGRTASYTNLDPGEYIFKVKGSNSDGVWNEKATILIINILPPWWKAWWAYCFYIFAFAGIIYGIRYYELNRQKLKHNLELEHLEAEKLKEVDHLKSRFFASISHEFRTPLTLIKGPVERLLKQIRNKYQIADLKRIHLNAVRINKLVEMYLELSKLENGKLKLEKEELDVIPLIKSVLASFDSMAEAVNIELKLITEVSYAICSIDREKFELIFINLLSNAVKFTPERGTITVNINCPGNDKLEFRVEDSGIGIPADSLRNIFDMYYQVDNEINSRVSGTGIGLTMVKELVSLHNGQINVESIVGNGTVFIINFPLVSFSTISSFHAPDKDALQIKSPPEEESCKKKDRCKELILIVEDNHQMAQYIQSHLETTYETDLAVNGKEGCSLAVKENPSLIISDVMMPEMDGYEFCTRIKNDFRTSHIPVILLTAKIEEKDMFKGLSMGADDYLKKPFKAEELVIRIKNLLENRKRLHKKFQTEKHTDLADFDITSKDKLFLEKCLKVIETHISDPDFSVEDFAGKMALSRIQLYRKIKALTGLSTNKYVQTIRLKKAVLLLSSDFGNISQVAYDCGFSSPSYFSELFRETFGSSPTEYMKKSKM